MGGTAFQLHLLGGTRLPCCDSLEVILGVSFAWVIATGARQRVGI